MLKRVLSLILVLVMLVSYVPPVYTYAQEIENAEAPVAEETIPATEEVAAETECPTDPTVEATEEVTEPATEPEAEPTQPTVPEETVAPTEEVEESLQIFEYVFTAEDDAEPEELYEVYAANLFYGNGISTFGTAAGKRLTGDTKLLYDAIVPILRQIANGQRASTSITIGQSYGSSTVDAEVTFAGSTLEQAQLSILIDALMADLPLELYWYEKTSGCSASYMVTKKLLQVTLKFYVADNYCAGDVYTADTAKTGKAVQAAANAKDIVKAYASANDYGKLIGYRNEICSLVDYNYAAADGNVFNTDIDPWQLMYVFDGDPETKVVCEGYSKAFQYLCDLTTFGGDVTSYMVTGNMITGNKAGAHMWNIVTIGGNNYLVDVTNSDAGTVGYDGRLFLAGGTGSIASGYTISSIRVDYYDDEKVLGGTGADSILNIASTKYVPPIGEGTGSVTVATGTCGTGLSWKLDDAGKLTITGNGKMTSYGDSTSVPWSDYAPYIKTVALPAGLTGIGDYAFYQCVKLTNVVIPVGVTEIGQSAFYGCTDLTDIYFGGTAAQWSAMAPDIGKQVYVHTSCTDAKNHWATKNVAATCEDGSYTCEICACGEERNRVSTGRALGHNMGDWFVETPAKCTTDGLQRKECSRCDYFEEDTIPAGHVWGQWGVDYPATCLNDGAQIRECKYCDAFETDVLTKLGHDWNEWVTPVAPGCETAGMKYRDCKRCEDKEEVILEALGHAYDKNHLCGTCGHIGGACGVGMTWRLDENDTLIISGTGKINDYASNATPWYSYNKTIKAINIEDGVTEIGKYAFDHCSAVTSVVIPDSVVSIANRAFNWCENLELVVIGNAVESIGTYGFAYCKNLKRVVIPASMKSIGSNAFINASLTDVYYAGTEAQWQQLGSGRPNATFKHYSCTDYQNHWAVLRTEPTCENSGRIYEGCACGYQNNLETLSALGHDMGEWATDKEPTCAEEGILKRGCSRCDRVETDKIEKLPHTEVVDAAVESSCTETGLTEGKHCAECSEILIAQEVIPVLTHNYEAVVTAPSCTVGGCTVHTCADCGDTYTDTLVDALGHVEIVDQGFAPTCTEAGLTDGKHCDRCGETYLAQEEIPAPGHSYAQKDGKHVCATCSKEVYLKILHDSVRMDLKLLSEMQLEYEISDYLAEKIRWSVDGDSGILEIDADGYMTALGAGSVYAVATVEEDGVIFSSSCLVEITEVIRLDGVQLNTAAVTTELYKTDYTGFEILLQLPQNYPIVESTYGLRGGSLMTSARFTSDAVNDLFAIEILDDRSVLLIPTDKAVADSVANAKSVLTKYTDTITVTVEGKDYYSEPLTINVKKTMPKLKATVAAFNSFYDGQTMPIVVTGGTATSIYENESKNTAKTTAIPTWLELNEDGTLRLKQDAPLKSLSGSAFVMVKTEEWRIPVAMTLSVKNTYKLPGVKLSASSVSASSRPDSNGIELKLLCTNKNETLSSLKVTGITAPEDYVISDLLEDGSFTLKAEEAFKAGEIILKVDFEGARKPMDLKLKVNTAAVTLKLASTSVKLNQAFSDHAKIKVTVTPADYRPEELDWQLTTVENKKTVDKTESGELEVQYQNGELCVYTTDKTPEKATYKLIVSAGGSKPVTATINVINAKPAVTLKVTGAMDLSFPKQTADIAATFTNYNGAIKSYSYSVAELKGKTVGNEDLTAKFHVDQDGKTFKIRCVDEDINLASTYAVTLKLILEDGSDLEKTVNLKVKRTIVKLKLSATSLSLNKLIGDEGSITVTCATKGYGFEKPIWKLTDDKNVDASGALDIRYEGDKLYVATKDETVYGKTYKITLKADEYGTAYVLAVKVPTKEKSTPTVTIKATGKVDVIRDESAVTITPTYKNCITTTSAEETITIYNGKKEDVTDLFRIEPNGKGGYTVTEAENGKLLAGTYKVKMVTMFGQTRVEAKEISMSVVMGSVKLTTKSSDTTMFAKDRNDYALVWFETTDMTLNEVSSITFKNAAQAKKFDIVSCGDGLFAIVFKDGKVDPSLLATGKATSKVETVSLNIFVDGNATTDPALSKTAKANATVNVKLTIVK